METKKINQLKKEIENILNDNKAMEIKSINLKNKTSIADFMIVASGNSSRHIQALSEKLVGKPLGKGIAPICYIGDTVSDALTVKNAKIMIPNQKFIFIDYYI